MRRDDRPGLRPAKEPPGVLEDVRIREVSVLQFPTPRRRRFLKPVLGVVGQFFTRGAWWLGELVLSRGDDELQHADDPVRTPLHLRIGAEAKLASRPGVFE